MNSFKYDDGKSDEDNFTLWRYANDCERETWNVAKLSDEDARRVYEQLKASGWLKKKSSNQSADDQKRIDHN